MSTSSARSTLRHVPGLDGLRGVALLGVLFFHANGALPGGYLGVDLFFVLSGFLITSLLLAEHERAGRIDLAAFWVRRARRLFPALLSLMPAIALYARFVAGADQLKGLRSEALATLGYVANWRAIFSHKSYWELFTAPSPLEHTWSLAIEEQFYVVWPLVVVLVLRRGSRRALLALTLAMTALSMTAMVLLFDPDPSKISRAYMGTDTRATAILLGATLAMLWPTGTTFSMRAIRALDVAGFVALAGLAVAWSSLDGESPFLYHGGFWLTQLAALLLIACAMVGRASDVARIFSVRPLTLVGTISYGLYLWHWPVDVVLTTARVHLQGASLHALQLAVTFAIAIVSYLVLERPIRVRGVPFGRPVFMVPAALALAVSLVVRGTHARPLPPPPAPPPPPFASAPEPEPVRFQIMLLGDSTANSLGWGLRGVRERGVAVELRGQDGCTMLADLCGGEQWADIKREIHPDATLLYLGGAFLHGVTVDGRWRKACHKGWDTKFQTNLKRRLGTLTQVPGTVWAVTIPYPLGPYDSADFRGEVDCINGQIRQAAASVEGVRVLELGERFCPSGTCLREHDGFEIRPDGVHYRIEGIAEISRWVLAQIGAEAPDAGVVDGSVEPARDAASPAMH